MIDSRELLDEIKRISTEIPDDWYTARYWSNEWGLSDSQTRFYLRKAIESGKMERKKFLVDLGHLKTSIFHYKVIV